MVDQDARYRPADDPCAAEDTPPAIDPAPLGMPLADEDQREPRGNNGPSSVVGEEDLAVREEYINRFCTRPFESAVELGGADQQGPLDRQDRKRRDCRDQTGLPEQSLP